MDGTRYSYVKSSDDRRLSFSFTDIGRGKILEVQEFLKKFRGQFIKVVDHRGNAWKVFVDTNPVTFTTNARGAPQGERGSFDLEFVGESLQLNPLTLSGLVAWFDASVASSITLSGSKVTQWDDLTGRGNHVVQDTDANRPDLVAGAINGKDAILFDDLSSHYLTKDDWTEITGFPLTVVAAFRTDEMTAGAVVAIGNMSSFNDYFALINATSNNNTMIWRNQQAAATAIGGNGVITVGQTAVSTGIETSNVSRTIFVDGSEGTPNTDPSTPVGIDSFSIGSVPRLTRIEYWSGHICEVLIFNEALTAANRQLAEAYLANKWGVTLV
jgi:hypothetical protein